MADQLLPEVLGWRRCRRRTFDDAKLSVDDETVRKLCLTISSVPVLPEY
jgi:hypothetical protein